MSNKILNLDLSKDPIMPAIVYGRVGDDRLQTVTVNLTRRDEVADLTGYDITFEGTTYNRQTKVFDSNNISSTPEGLKKGTFDYTFPNMAFAVAGKYEQAYFSIVKDGKRDSTAGFEIYVDGNADIDAPEAETIITEYNKLVAELNELQNQAIDEMNRNFTEAQGRISELEVQINDLRNKIDQALTDFENGNFWTKEESFNKEESSANVIDQVIGKESNKEAMSLDFKDKVSGSFVENANKITSNQYNSLLPPSNGSWLEFPQANIDKVKALDKELFSRNEKANGYMQQVLICYDVLGYLINRLGEQFFTDRGAKDVPSQVAIIRSMISDLAGNVWGYGSGPNGNKMTFQVWTHVRSKWEGPLTTTNSTVTRIKRGVGSTNDYIDSAGKMYFLVNAEPSDGVTASTLNIDYVSLQFDLNVSANDHIKSMMAADRGENLGNVDNYKTANQTEAESGTATDKFMTPLRTKQFYDQQAIERPKFLYNTTNFCAHRGNNADFPENSSEALKSVTRHRYTEFDVNITKDGKWVVMHDDTVDRMTNGTGRVDSFTYAQIRALRIDTGANIGILRDWEKVIPSMDEAIKYCKMAGSVPFIEIKTNNYTDSHLQEFMNILKQHKVLNGGCVVISFDKTILERLRNMSNEIDLSWVMNSVTQTELNECIRLRMSADVAYNNATVTKDMIKSFHDKGLQFCVWTAPDDAFSDLQEKGVDVITTNSRSGDLRWGLVGFDGGFSNNSSVDTQRESYVEEISKGIFRVSFNVINGSNTKTTRIITFPDWAVPMFNSWQFCTIRTSSGSAFATVDIIGRTGSKPGIVVGLDWGNRTTWAAGNITYTLY